MSLRQLGRFASRILWLERNRGRFSEGATGTKRRLFVDVSVIARHDAQTGIQRVVRAVWAELKKRGGAEFELVPVTANYQRGYCYARPDFLEQAREDLISAPVRARSGDVFLGLDLSAQFVPLYRNQLQEWREAGATIHLVVYDLLPLTRQDLFNSRTVSRFGQWLDVLITHCDQALCISDHVAHDLQAHLGNGVKQPRIGRLQLAGDIEASLPSRGVDERISDAIERVRRTPTILMVGTIEPRKSYDIALAAFELHWRKRGQEAPSLMIVGKPGWRTAALQERIRNHPEHGRRLHWLEEVSDEALAQFYQACLAVFLASVGEGFGLPTAEAALNRRWVLVRDLPVFHELRLPNLRYFTKDSPEDLARALEALLQAANAAPPPAAELPSWSRCVERLVEELGFASSGAVVGTGPNRSPEQVPRAGRVAAGR